MSLWLWIAMSVTLLALWSGSAILLRRDYRALWDSQVVHREFLDGCLARLASLQGQLAALHETLARRDLAPPEAPPPIPLWTGSFLPTDEHAAETERRLLVAEDHAISATGPTRYSSMPSRPSGSASRAEVSTPRGRSSGRP